MKIIYNSPYGDLDIRKIVSNYVNDETILGVVNYKSDYSDRDVLALINFGSYKNNHHMSLRVGKFKYAFVAGKIGPNSSIKSYDKGKKLDDDIINYFVSLIINGIQNDDFDIQDFIKKTKNKFKDDMIDEVSFYDFSKKNNEPSEITSSEKDEIDIKNNYGNYKIRTVSYDVDKEKLTPNGKAIVVFLNGTKLFSITSIYPIEEFKEDKTLDIIEDLTNQILSNITPYIFCQNISKEYQENVVFNENLRALFLGKDMDFDNVKADLHEFGKTK